MPLETPLLEMHRSSGATIGEYFGTQLPARFGEFAEEYAALRRAVALVDTNFRATFSFAGPDRQRYLNALLTSNVRDLKPGQGAVGLLLNPQGHILAEIATFALESRILAMSHAMSGERTYSTFDKFIIMDDVELEDVTLMTLWAREPRNCCRTLAWGNSRICRSYRTKKLSWGKSTAELSVANSPANPRRP
jgi:glycine cleavage system aminomethyltransferase T